MSSSAVKKPSLNIHRFTSTNRITKLKKSSIKKANLQGTKTENTRDKHDDLSLDKNSKEYLESLINSIFFPLSSQDNEKYDQYLPLLTSSTEVDLQLHAIIGLLLKNFVLNWYDRITDDYSNEFFIELVFTVAHITRNLEEKLRKIDYKEVILDDLFVICDLHLSNYKKLKSLVNCNMISLKLSVDESEQLLELLQLFAPHLGVEHQKLYLMTLSDNLLLRTLPNDTYGSELTRSILISILSQFVFQNCVEKLSEPYLLWEIIGKVCDALLTEKEPKPVSEGGLGFVRSIGHTILYTTSALSLASQVTRETDARILYFHVFQFLNNLLDFSYRFPIFTMMLTIINKFVCTNNKLNHILQNLINNFLYKFLLNENFIVKVLSISRSVIFPKDDVFYLEPRFIPTTDEELEVLMNDTKLKMLAVFNKLKWLQFLLYLHDNTALENDVTSFLQFFQVKEINKHLVLMLIDLLFLRLFPDMLI